jgi:heat shock protein HslJ
MLLCGGSLLTVAQDSGANVQMLYVGPESIPCEDAAPQSCLQVKTDPDESYSLFYDQIEGFDYKPGFEYTLQVEVDPVEKPAADSSGLHYTLLETLSKTRALQGNIWLLVSYLDAEGEMVNAMSESQFTLTFSDELLTGNTGCNAYYGNYALADHSLQIDQVVSTEASCEAEAVMQQAAFLSRLDSAASYAFDGDQLQLHDADGALILSFVPLQPGPLVDTNWVLFTNIHDKSGTGILLSGTEITAHFDDEGYLSGSAGCNTYSALYAVDDALMTLGPVVVTQKTCTQPAGVMDQESAYLSALKNVIFYRIDDTILTLMAQDQELLLIFMAQD